MESLQAKTPTKSLSLPSIRPMASAVRVTLFEREVRERLSSAAVEILLGAARVISEGRLDPGNPLLAAGSSPAAGRPAYFGSTMLTVDLRALAADVREACDDQTCARLASLASSDARLLRRVRAVAEREAIRIAGRRFASFSTELRVRAQSSMLYVDVDVEAELVPPLRVVRGGGQGG